MSVVREKLQELSERIEQLRARENGFINTTERRHEIDEKRVGVIDLVESLMPSLLVEEIPTEEMKEAWFQEWRAAQQAGNQSMIHAKDLATHRADELERTMKLWTRTNRWMPISGVTCDSADCDGAIGIVGAKIPYENEDSAAAALIEIAEAAGWSVEGDVSMCPKCLASRKQDK